MKFRLPGNPDRIIGIDSPGFRQNTVRGFIGIRGRGIAAVGAAGIPVISCCPVIGIVGV